MKTTKRFENAVKKLYDAFHRNKLEAQSCEACAVGNIVGTFQWKSAFNVDDFECDQKGPSGLIEIKSPLSIFSPRPESAKELEKIKKKFDDTGYSLEELSQVEYLFMRRHYEEGLWTEVDSFLEEQEERYGDDYDDEACLDFVKETQFKALCDVVSYLAELDNLENPLDYTKLFEQEDKKPKYKLEEAF